MQTKLILAAIAGTCCANNLQPRQTNTDDGDGLDSITACLSVLAGMPTPADSLLDFIASNTETDYCRFTVPQSLSSAFKSYTSAEISWFSENSAAISSNCPIGNQPSTLSIPDCSSTGAGGNSQSTTTSSSEESSSTESSGEESSSTESSGESSTTTGSSNPSVTTGGASSTTKSAGAVAARETGVALAAVAAAAGFALAAL